MNAELQWSSRASVISATKKCDQIWAELLRIQQFGFDLIENSNIYWKYFPFVRMVRNGLLGQETRSKERGNSMSANVIEMRRRLFLKSLGAAAVAGTMSSSFAQLKVDILGVGANQFPIAIPAFIGNEGAPENIAEIVGNDLVRSGAFRLVDGPVPTSYDMTPEWSKISAVGAGAYVIGEVKKTPDGRYDLQFRLFDPVKRQETDEANFVCAKDDLRLYAHKIADRIFERLTGEKGDFASRIAYVAQQGRKSFAIMVADSDGHNPQAALRSKEPIISIAWSPNGRQIAYTTFETGKPTVWIHDLSSGKRRQVAGFRGNNSAPAFSPDGNTLAVALSKGGITKIYLMNVNGQNVRPFTEGSSIDTEPAFSPDGQYIYFTSDRGGNPQIYRKPVGGGSAERVSFGNAYAVSPAVSPKNDQLAYIVRSGGTFQLVQQDLATGNVIPLSQVGKNESPSYSPNGNMIIYAAEVGGKGVLSTVSTDGSAKSRLSGLSGDIREPAWGPTIS